MKLVLYGKASTTPREGEQVTTVAQMISPVPGQYVVSQPGINPLMGSRRNDGYQSLTGSVVRNTMIGAGLGAVAGLPAGGIGALPGAAIGGAIGAGSALIRHPRVANAVGDGMKGAMAGAAGGAVVGSFTPFGPLAGAAAGAVGGVLTGTISGMLKKYNGGKFSVEGQTTLFGRISRGFMIGATSGGVLGLGAGALFGGIGAIPGAIAGALIGGVGGALFGATSGTVDAATGAKGARFFGNPPNLPGLPGRSSLPGLPDFGRGSSGGYYCPNTGQWVGQSPGQYVVQRSA